MGAKYILKLLQFVLTLRIDLGYIANNEILSSFVYCTHFFVEFGTDLLVFGLWMKK